MPCAFQLQISSFFANDGCGPSHEDPSFESNLQNQASNSSGRATYKSDNVLSYSPKLAPIQKKKNAFGPVIKREQLTGYVLHQRSMSAEPIIEAQ